jgi:hypothetical protein
MMDDPLSLLVILTSSIWCGLGLYWWWVAGRIPTLTTGECPSPEQKVSVIVTASNEADTIEPALRSLLALEYRPLEIIVVNDRSTDDTGSIIDRLVTGVGHAKSLHVEHLPDGWLGKVHAMHRATEIATGDWFLFTDADVVFHPGVIRDAVAQAEADKLDHFSLLPRMLNGPFLLDITVACFAQVITHLAFGLWAIPFGAGAFNMVRRSALEASEGLSWLKMEVADDTGLALLIANNGGKSHAVTAVDSLSLSWYPTLGAMFRGLEKNAGLLISQGKIWRFAMVWIAGGSLCMFPFLGLALTPDLWPIVVAGELSYIIATWRLRGRLGAQQWLAIFAPAGFFLIGSVGLWSMVQMVRQDGITWRGTHYPLKALIEGQQVKL